MTASCILYAGKPCTQVISDGAVQVFGGGRLHARDEINGLSGRRSCWRLGGNVGRSGS